MEGVPLGPQEKPGTLLFLPGTGRPNPALSDQVREQVNTVPGLSGWSVQTIEWAAAAAENVSGVPALPERYSAEDPPALSDASLALALFGADVSTADPVRQASVAGAVPSVPEAARLGETLQDLVLGVVTDAAVRHRIRLTDAAGDFFSKVAYYLRQGEGARTVLADALGSTDQDAPVVLFAHSLGSVAAVDLLSSPDFTGSRVDLLVTLGSPAPWFYQLDALAYLGPGRGGNAPAAPWLNFWDERDLFAFCAERVFAGRMGRITDSEVQSGKPFPESHQAYFSDPRVYRLLWEHLQETESGKPGSGNGTGV
ncbi:hypothetical protein MUK71_00210 [Arthrobacter zhangbolii]|uniref:Alpha/beta hydrolase n=1 Tax=Arthrobacter zhangbolii TaxID=2886936 RepID=A0A9X1S7Y2_9MICC|nr:MULTISPECIES: hypothetical protein [Arthrobacter]MCC3271990.1 hypothetical protein [Arthrobacter zhangbolii]MCC3294528.1 hypothetical protein [Arthrobacter zhangbolii]MDN3903049.1 hypothetical protein [Arthrobacter sp. YD2]UON92127.1 hypothetical protein MUK71_00210 [Arthrobacter zhangbolii]